MNFLVLIIFCSLFYFTQNVNDFIFTNLTCYGAPGYVEVNVCEFYKKRGSMEANFLNPLNNFKVSLINYQMFFVK